MENYYLHDGTECTGPFSLEELRAKNIDENQLIWTEGMKDWTTADKIPSLESILKKTPPPFHKVTQTEKAGTMVGKYLLTITAAIILFVVGYHFFGYHQTPPTITYPALTSYVDPEHLNPASYLIVNGTYKPNLWGNKEQISGTVTNNAHHTNYKDIHVRINFMSQTNSVISSKEYILYQFVPYGASVPFNLIVDKPGATATVGCSAVGGTFY